ncbi:hypothetical protein GEOBRER4_n2793 [Citrifermentans bremense]|uniref:HEAT repeat domain-containing protein n=2 Tax=Citrifermentans bremense TaxID=60035 RepID=A0A7R7FSD5_9BACT|nr:HEAT repeat domain-containing protein [Citrifermentans bremense]BCO11476.1 hypothetical protein GEOBRER4_n2793 [Citrifermentans bremense]
MPQDNFNRIDAIVSLSGADMGEVMEQVLDALWDRDPEVRRAAVSVLACSFDDAHGHLLLSMLDDEDLDLVRTAAYFLLNVEDEDLRLKAIRLLRWRREGLLVPVFLKALRNELAFIGREAAGALVDLQDPQVILPLLELLAEPEPGCNALENAELVLSSLQAPLLVEALNSLLGDTVAGGRAARILGKRSDLQSRDALLDTLNNGGGQARIHAMRGISINRDHRALKPLFSFLQGEDPSLRAGAIFAAESILHCGTFRFRGGRLGTEEVSALMQTAHDEDLHVRSSALAVLGLLHAGEAVPILLKALTDPSSYVVVVAAQALAGMGCIKAVVPLLNLLDSHHGQMTVSFIQCLGNLGDAAAEEKLRLYLDDEDWDVRVEAARSLYRLGAVDVWNRLVQALGEAEQDQFYTRVEVAETIADSNDPRAVEVLLDTLKMLTLEHPSDNRLLVSLISLLGKMGDPRALEPIGKWWNYHYDESDDWDRVTLSGLKRTIVKALQRLKRASCKK